ncbi:hypothetical protein JW848_03725 [Candidatus Bipolaricaulota bacterium]|nr:hypothetical protein [Candidatus Bipolaricaulota bacterium]
MRTASKRGLYAGACLLVIGMTLWFGRGDWVLPIAIVGLVSYVAEDASAWLAVSLSRRWRWCAAILAAGALAGLTFLLVSSTREGPRLHATILFTTYAVGGVFWQAALWENLPRRSRRP